MNGKNLKQEVLKIGKWQLSDQLGILASPEGKSLVLEPRLARLLYVLATDDRIVLSRSYLMEQLWPDTIVNEESLTRAVADLRKLLSQQFAHPPTIETIRKRGYQITISEGPKVYALKWKIDKKQAYGLLGAAVLLLTIWIFA